MHVRVNAWIVALFASLACPRARKKKERKGNTYVPVYAADLLQPLASDTSSFLHRDSKKKKENRSSSRRLGRPLLSRVQPPIAASLHSFTSPPPLSFHQSQALVHFNGGSRSTIETSHLPVVLGHHRRYKKPRAHLVHSVPPPHLHAQAPAKGPENFVAGVRGRLHAIFVSGRCTSPTSRQR